jgi:hypothetical protein
MAEQRVIDAKLEVLPVAKTWDANARAAAFADPATRALTQKPCEWAEILTTQSGVFAVSVRMPDGATLPLTSLSLMVEPGKVGIISVRVAAGQRPEPVVKPEVG